MSDRGGKSITVNVNRTLFDWVALLISTATLIVLVVTVLYAERQFHAMQAAVNEAKNQTNAALEQAETIDRPWLTVSFTVEDELDFTNGHMDFVLISHLKNVGHSAANNIKLASRVFITKYPWEMEARGHELCEPGIAKRSTWSMQTLFPGESSSIPFPVSLGIDSQAISNKGSPHELVSGVYLVGCVEYQYAASTRQHQTRFAYSINRKFEMKHGFGSTAFEIGKNVPFGDIEIWPAIWGDHSAF